MIDELVDAGVVGADMGLGQLPQPAGGGVGGRREDALRARAVLGHRREAELDRYRLQGSEIRQIE